jgi:SAM-dependent methyltransferase
MPDTTAPGLRRIRAAVRRLRPLGSSASYWERRYRAGGSSGDGSYGDNADAKAEIVNRVVREHGVGSVVEFGCGDGNQLALLELPRYLGLDVSETAVRMCTDRFAGDGAKSFLRYDPEYFADRAGWLAADLALSQEVIFHLVEDDVFDRYMSQLFDAASRLVLICSSDRDERPTKHVRHRTFTTWVAANRPQWRLSAEIANPRPFDPASNTGLDAGFYLYELSAPNE